ncbi:hypothetical protein [Pseudoalteromonas sp. OOF1S-7]|uniref:glycoside hydrolase family protein n=1 Tax=Pseudoalteromonas sp. OOF1S-7 TaxID=2917757 RepID=UPI001EF6853F|nr:hypothetical protein [Pseudoalteromonas sp. OOF1S-7]MCG7536125.1 hypothetical protein [Pseudoalteromonas sp. OOF1S-7]
MLKRLLSKHRTSSPAVRHICHFEGVIDHLYLDTRGNPTIGVGFHVASQDAFTRLSLRNKHTNRPASRAQKRQEYSAFTRLPAGKTARWYAQHCTLHLPHSESMRLLELQIGTFELELTRLISPENGYTRAYQQLPDSVRLAMLDLAYNLGTTNLSSRWPRLLTALKREDWQQAAHECARKHVSKARNQATRQLFMQAANRDSMLIRLLRRLWRKLCR